MTPLWLINDAPGFYDRAVEVARARMATVGQEEFDKNLIQHIFLAFSEVFSEEDYAHYAGMFYPYRKRIFLDTFYWQMIRKFCFFSHPGCQFCESRFDLEIHHSNYSICGKEHEHPNTLFVLCRSHHQAEHEGKDFDLVFGRNQYCERTTSYGSPMCAYCSGSHNKAKWMFVKTGDTYFSCTCDDCRTDILQGIDRLQGLRGSTENNFVHLEALSQNEWQHVLRASEKLGGSSGKVMPTEWTSAMLRMNSMEE